MRFLTAMMLAAGLVFGTAACGGGSPEIDPPQLSADGARNGTKIVVSQTNFSHHIGQTQCPQKIGTITITNDRSEPIKFKASRGAGDHPGAITLAKTEGNLAAGESVTFDVVFNCSQTTDVSEQWIVNVESAVDNSHLNDIAVNVNGTVR